jgi:hypothetical protein
LIERQTEFSFYGLQSVKEQMFWEFNSKHPEVYGMLLSMARRVRLEKGIGAVVGITLLYETVRWERWLASLSDESPKLSNDHKPFYARLLMKNHPELKGIFRLKAQKVRATFEEEGSLSNCERW